MFSCVSINNESLMTLHYNPDRKSGFASVCHEPLSKDLFAQQIDVDRKIYFFKSF